MTDARAMPDHELISPRDAAMWAAYHDIRRRVLFEARGRFGVYVENHPDEVRLDFHPKVLLWRGTPIGVVRIDLTGSVAIFRRVAIREDLQRQGHGRAMFRLGEDFARVHGCRELQSHFAPDAVEFYRKQGFERAQSDSAEPAGTESVFMRKAV